MCNRYTLRTLAAAAEIFRQLTELAGGWTPRYNVALTQRMPVIIRRQGETKAELLSFGIMPPPRNATDKPTLLANARAETLLDKPTFRGAAAHRRCLIPADGFYEWEKRGETRLPHYFTLTDGRPFFFGGLWEPAREEQPAGYAIVTTAPNPLLARIHDRMPVMLGPNSGLAWLGDEPLAAARLAQLSRPLSAEMMQGHPVDPRVNSVRYQEPDCVTPAAAELF